jgi:hydroxymethylpyrimidine kinase/phosphomethylpyrimidine kinase
MTRPRARRRRVPRALTIAGSDSGGGAGIQADLKTFAALGVHGTSVVAALTAQSTRGVHRVLAVPASFVRAQLDAVLDDLGADAVKTGMLLDARTVETVARALAAHGTPPLVVDPVIAAKDGATLLTRRAQQALRARLLPLATIVTPNRAEAAALTGGPVRDRDEMERAAHALVALGVRAAVVTGGGSARESCDLLVVDGRARWLRARRVPGPPPHGTGCTFATAIAAGLARGATIEDAVVAAKRYTHACIRRARRIGSGHPVLGHLPWRPRA